MHRSNILAGPYLDRIGHLRQDGAWIDSILADPRSRAIPVWRSMSLISEGAVPHAGVVHLRDLPQELRSTEHLIFLGRADELFYFAVEMPTSEPPDLLKHAAFRDLRVTMAQLAAPDAGILAYARAMISWRRDHRFCGTCGTQTRPSKGGHVLTCVNPACGHDQFPRLDPAIIVLVSDGERALLGRQASWPRGRYSTIAGFVEPGESLEDAVAREVLEESGVHVNQVQYHSSQPWPFPSSLMLGFTARASTQEIQLKDNELEDARWFSRADLIAGDALLPPQQSISFSLIEDWFNDAGVGILRDIAANSPWPATR